MKIKLLGSLFLYSMLCLSPAFGAVSDPSMEPLPDVYLLDDFEDENMNKSPEWWRFGNLQLNVVRNSLNDKTETPYLESFSSRFTGFSENWYVGGAGTYLRIRGTKYNALKLVIKGYGKESGTMLIELYDDDNKNGVIERNPYSPSRLLADDKFIYNLRVDWEGWRVVIIPISRFVDDNPRVGDDIWNPDTLNGSGGLVQIQLIGITASPRGLIQFDIDSIKFYRQ